jgi:hypothetical protein
MSRRNIFRDHYDIYAILQDEISLKELVEICGRYSRHSMKSRDIETYLREKI